MKPFLILQLRPETEASDNEFEAILAKGGLRVSETHRIRLDRESLPADIRLTDFAGVIVGGGPGCISDPPGAKSPSDLQMENAVLGLMPAITGNDFPFLGCCYGIGILAHHLGARVGKGRYAEPVGAVECQMTQDGRKDPLLKDLPDTFRAFVGHKEAVEELPKGTSHLLSSGPCPYQMIRYGKNVYATQFHPEADGHVFEVRINIYKDMGYFPAKDANSLIAMCRAENVSVPERILRSFVLRYRICRGNRF